MKDQKDKVLLLGFSDDLEKVAKEFASALPITCIAEDATDDDLPRAADLVIYVMSADTGYSTQLHSLFAYVHDRVAAAEEYLVALEAIDLSKMVFPEISDVPLLSIADLTTKLRHI